MLRNLFRLTLSGLVLFGAAGTAQASDLNGEYAIRGVGAQSCTTLDQQLLADPDTMPIVAASWLLGYMTALNRVQEGTYDVSPVSDAAGLLQMVIALCDEYPDQLVEVVAETMIRFISPARVTAASPNIETVSGEQRATVRQEVLQRMQLRLAELGYAVGNTDGAFDQETSAAFAQYQTAENLPVTGIADAATILRVLVELGSAPPPE